MVWVFCVLMLVPIGTTLLQALIFPAMAPRVLYFVVALGGTVAVGGIVLRRGRPRLSGAILVFALLVLGLLGAYTGGGVRSISYVSVVMLVFLSAWLVGVRGALATFAVCVLAGLALLAAESRGMLPQASWQASSLYFWYGLTSLILLALLLQWRLLYVVGEAQAALRRSEERSRATFEQAAVGMCHTDLDGCFVRVNRRFSEITGYDWAELRSLSFRELTHPDDLPASEACRHRLMAGEIETYTIEKRYVRRDGVTVWVTLTASPIRGPQGQVELLLGVAQEITERKLADWAVKELNITLEDRVAERTAALTAANDQLQAEIAVREWTELALRESEQRYRALLESLQQGVVVIQDARVVFCNQALATMIGSTVPDLMALDPEQLFNFLDPSFRDRLRSDVTASLSSGTLTGDGPMLIYRASDGVPRWLNSSTTIIMHGGRPALLAVISDITALKVVEERLRQSESRLHMLLANTPAVIFTSRSEGDFGTTFISDSIRKLLGYEPERFLDDANFWFGTMHPADVPRVFAEIGLLYERGWQQLEYRFRHADGSWRWLENGLSLLGGPEVEQTEIIGYLIDITERKEAEEALRQSRDELRAANAELRGANRLKDEFLANMSHELRTPLNAILGRAELLSEELHGPLNARQLRSVASIEESGRHLLELINDILDLSKIEANGLTLQCEPVSVNDLCQASLRMVAEVARKKGIGLSVDLDPRATRIMGDPRRLKQILVNLISNAVKFTPAGGSVGLDLRIEAETETISFSVWDNGIGIAAEDLPRLFKPFAQLDSSLSRQYEGTGLGLSLVSRLTDLHGGSVTVESTPGQGSRFTVSLPWQPWEQQPVPAIEEV